jgi:hypothetical protein
MDDIRHIIKIDGVQFPHISSCQQDIERQKGQRYTHACNRLIIWCSRSYIIGIRKLVDAMLQQWDSTLKAWQNIVSKVEPFLNPAKS